MVGVRTVSVAPPDVGLVLVLCGGARRMARCASLASAVVYAGFQTVTRWRCIRNQL